MHNRSEQARPMLLAQEGNAPSDIMSEGLKEGIIDGVVLSPRIERCVGLGARLGELRRAQPNCVIYFDPQVFLAQNSVAHERHFNEYPYYADVAGSGLDDLVSPTAISRLVQHVLAFQESLDFSYVVSPTLYLESVDSRICQTALSLSSASCDYCASELHKPLLVNVCLSENALQDNAAFHRYLDDLTSLRSAQGFYLTVGHAPRQNEYSFSRANMTMLMYMCRVLVLNGFEVHMGYTSWPGLLLQAAGVSSTACGWNGKTRSFLWTDLEPQKGGQRAKPLFSCATTLSSVLVHPTLEILTTLLGRDTIFGAEPRNRPANYDPLHSQPSSAAYALQHWDTLRTLMERISQGRAAKDRLGLLKALIGEALVSTRTFYNQTGVSVGHTQHLDMWSRAIDDFVGYADSKGAELL